MESLSGTRSSSRSRRRAGPGRPSPFPWADPDRLAASLRLEPAPQAEPSEATKTRERSRTAARWLGVSEGPGPSKARTRRGMFARFLAVADALAVLGAAFIGFAVAGRELPLGALAVVPFVIALAKLAGLYDHDDAVMRRSTLDEAPQLFELATLTALGGWLAEAGLSDRRLEPAAVLVGWVTLFLLLMLARMFARRQARLLAPPERILFVGGPGAYTRLVDKLVPADRLGVAIVGWVPFRPGEDSEEVEVPLGTAADLPEIIARHDVHRVVVEGESDHREMLDVVRLSKLLGLQVSLLPALLDVVGSSVQFEDVQGLRLMGIRSFGLSWSSRVVKRSLDLVGAGTGLFLLSPLFALVALAVKLDSRGPVLFCQNRVGRNGRVFGMLKFRSMVDGADDLKDDLRHLNEADGLFKIADDPRITRVGRWLRRTSLDELPQLFNVLKGEMSLVGPRPLVTDDDERVQGWHRQRLHLTPGMTGPWQVLGGSSRIPLDEMVKIDYLYVANWSLWNDLKILVRTVPVVLGFRGV